MVGAIMQVILTALAYDVEREIEDRMAKDVKRAKLEDRHARRTEFLFRNRYLHRPEEKRFFYRHRHYRKPIVVVDHAAEEALVAKALKADPIYTQFYSFDYDDDDVSAVGTTEFSHVVTPRDPWLHELERVLWDKVHVVRELAIRRIPTRRGRFPPPCAECGTRHWNYYVKCRGDKTVYWLVRAFPTFPTEVLRMIMREWY